MSSDFLKLEVGLLLAKYGRKRVLKSIAAAEALTVDAIENEIAQSRTQSTQRSNPLRACRDEVVDRARRKHPEMADIIGRLAVRYESRTFLPNLRDVEHFVNRLGVNHPKLKSRASALPIVLDAISTLSKDDAEVLLSSSPAESSYSLLAREIMQVRTKTG